MCVCVCVSACVRVCVCVCVLKVTTDMGVDNSEHMPKDSALEKTKTIILQQYKHKIHNTLIDGRQVRNTV